MFCPPSTQTTWTKNCTGGYKKAPPHPRGLAFFSFTPHSYTLWFEPYQCAPSTRRWWWWAGRRSSTRSRKPSLSLLFSHPPWYLPLYSSSLAISRGHEAAGSLFRLRLKRLCLWACVSCVTSPRTRATVREWIRVFCQVLRSAAAGLRSVSQHTHTFLFTRDSKTTTWPVFLVSFSLQMFKKKEKKKDYEWGRTGLSFWPIAGGCSRWRGCVDELTGVGLLKTKRDELNGLQEQSKEGNQTSGL